MLKDFLSCGIGRQLHNALLSEVNGVGCSYIWLLVWEKNSRAITFYIKLGCEIKVEQWDTVGNDTFLFYRMEKRLIRENKSDIAA